jgi:DNA-binding response OmpR family regulator
MPDGTLQTIVLVEDNADDVTLLRRAFQRAAIANPLQVIGNGEAARHYLAGEGAYANRTQYPLPTLMLLDLKLPRVSGFEVLAWLRSQPGLKRLVTVILTSSPQTADITRAYDLGANSYLVKPGTPHDLVALVHALHLYWITYNATPPLSSGTG